MTDEKVLANVKYYDSLDRTKVDLNWPLWFRPLLLYERSLLGDVRGKKILDVGGGVGRDTFRFKKMGAIVTVVDISPKNLEAMPFSCEKICDNAEELSKIKDNHYDVEVALAGFNKKDIKVSYADGQLSIESVRNNKTKEKDENGNIIHRGIAKRYFKKSFSVADNCEVKGAELKDGLLKVSLERIIPEAQKPRVIDIK